MMEEQNRDNKKILTRYFVFILFVGIIIIGIIFNLINTAFVHRNTWLEVAEKLKRPDVSIPPTRGNIYSYDGKLMAVTTPLYYTYIDFRADGLKQDTLYKYIDNLAFLLSKKFGDRSTVGYKQHILKGYKLKSREYPLISKKISYQDLKEIKTYPFLNKHSYKNGFKYKKMAQRTKPFGSLASRTIGDIYGDLKEGLYTQGKNGLELQYDSLLRGQPGRRSLRRVGGRTIGVVAVEPIDGQDIVSTIDIGIQDIVETALLNKMKEIGGVTGTAVVMEVKTGQIKAISNLGRTKTGAYREIKNFAVADVMEPGSTFKIASVVAALDDGKCLATDTVDVGKGVAFFGRQKMTDHNAHRGGYGKITVAQAIWYSSNIGIAKVIEAGYEKEPEKFVEKLHDMGLGVPIDIGIPGAGQATIRFPNDKNNPWSRSTLPWLAHGYESQIPPIYTLMFFNAIANEGALMKPYFTKEILKNGKSVKKFYPTVLKSSICKKNTLNIVQKMMVNVVDSGTGKAARSELIKIAGKTGTAVISEGGRYGLSGRYASFCGYFPADQPKYSCIVVIKAYSGGGGGLCAPVVKEIAERIYAESMPIEFKKYEPDSLRKEFPLRGEGSGNLRALKAVASNLNLHLGGEASGDGWVKVDVSDSKLELKMLDFSSGLVPDVVNMGAKDAVYLMERLGLSVHLVGSGKVYSQSITSGSRPIEGKTVTLYLQ